ncbi:MAG: type II secretion system protein [Candidatus Riflebacteria bacterium]|nr:type II secretion system protein [Candidatus Riflebacteria bacterium]
MRTTKTYKKTNLRKSRAFTLVEILVSLFIMALIATPFIRMFTFGVKGSIENKEQILAYNLAREKMEQAAITPYHLLKSDYENYRDIYKEAVGDHEEAFYSEEVFLQYFTDVFTEDDLKKSSELNGIYSRLSPKYKERAFAKLELYPSQYAGIRRVMKVTPVTTSQFTATANRLKKVHVFVYDKDNKLQAELATYIGTDK